MPLYQPPSGEVLKTLETVPNMYLIISPDLHILTASDLYLKAVETTRETITGKHIFEAFPDNPDNPDADGVQNINASLQEVLRTRRPHYMAVQKYDVPDHQNPGKFIVRYWDPSHTPVLNEQGEVSYIIQLATNVTDRVLTELALARSIEQERKTFAHVQSLNNDLANSNEELNTLVEELEETQQSLKELNDDLEEKILIRTKAQAESEARLRKIFEQAPLGLSILTGPNLVIELANDKLLQIMNKDKSIFGKPYELARPEPEIAPYRKILSEVYQTGIPYTATETKVFVSNVYPYKWGYFNFTYQPIKNDWGEVTAILTIAEDTTERVLSRLENDRVNQQLQMAIEAANIGSWHIDPVTKELDYSQTLARIFGYEGEDRMTYDQAINQVVEEYRKTIIDSITKAITNGGNYDFTYAQHRFNDNEIIWLRSLGKTTADEQGNHTVFTGVVMDITEQKQDEQRKNDFISMVSHELKTPLTSLNAYLQLLQIRARKAEDSFTFNAMDKCVNQVKKMTTMINSFLNVSRLESGKIHIDWQQFDMAVLIKEVETEVAATVMSHRFKFEPVVTTFVNADRDKIGQVIQNFISNAVKYSPMGTTVYVACLQKDGNTEVHVRDEGMGISPEDIGRLFDRFYRVKNNNNIAGFGIGLYLCAEIIQRHEGRIWVESDPGKGSSFYFSLPIAKQPAN